MRERQTKMIRSILVIAIICILILSIHLINEPYQLAARRLELPKYDILKAIIRFQMVAIGVAVEWKRLVSGIRNGFKINFFGLIFCVLLVLLSMTPILIGYRIGMASVGYSFRNPISLISFIVTNGVTWNTVCLLSGIGIVRTITEAK